MEPNRAAEIENVAKTEATIDPHVVAEAAVGWNRDSKLSAGNAPPLEESPA